MNKFSRFFYMMFFIMCALALVASMFNSLLDWLRLFGFYILVDMAGIIFFGEDRD